MNPVEQRQRHTAVSRVEARCEVAEAAVMGLAQTIVDDRAERDRQIKETIDNLNLVLSKGHADQQVYIDTADRLVQRHLEQQIVAFRDRAFWDRLRWLFLGI